MRTFQDIFCCFAWCKESDTNDTDRSGTSTPLLSRSPDYHPSIDDDDGDDDDSSFGMPARKTYGTKRSVVSSASAKIFGRAETAGPATAANSARESLSDLSLQFESRLNIQDHETVEEEDATGDHVSEEIHSESNETTSSAPLYTLNPLIEAYRADKGKAPQIHQWREILRSDSKIEKIAEASYAEVYRVTTKEGTSILKMIPLKLSSDPASLDMYHACPVESTISELRIMDALTEVPGFVAFKESYIIRGKPGVSILEAWEDYSQKHKESDFPHPSDYSASSTFLVIELGDAGDCLDLFTIRGIDQVWDILLNVIIILARAETAEYEFEHRDLHENNICVIETAGYNDPKPEGNLKFAFTGINVTLIDYGLSRAKLANGQIAYNDLENDLSIFRGSAGNMQFDIYRRMRTHLFTDTRTMLPREWHDEASKSLSNGHTWAEFKPYSNVLWLRYLLSYLTKSFKKTGENQADLAQFRKETAMLLNKLNVQTKVENGGFRTAQEVLEFVVQEGWVTEEQLAVQGVDTTFLSEG